ncbi:lipase [Spongiactinospora gelatinilytica]|uniref:Lipase n=1 Tax=Spongiactinospora gelatinilytica TaxID=2666298 RepID=A0A2W2H4Z6_9ACTN|nr:sugar ABC transporter ATP-binding protein [Spongiactinospora gelatinilytica]PZG55542.1 lipase [Spongiactinospora gelatinilytica]
MPETAIVLRVRGVRKTYGGVAALRDADVDIRRGEVHCLAGENGSGKSTLIKIVSGVEQPDSGTITLDGHDVGRLTPTRAVELGIQVIHQDLSLFPNLSVAENIAMVARVASRRRLVSRRDAMALARATTERLGVSLDLGERVENLPVAQRQLAAICRAFAHDAKVLFMDEPTTALTWREVDALLALVDTLRAEGLAVVFVSHKLEEVFRISDRVTVLRNGEVVHAGEVKDLDRPTLVRVMTGQDVTEDRDVTGLPPDARPVLETRGLGRRHEFAGVSFSVRAGEVVGLTGLLGSGRTEIAEAIFGMRPADTGDILVDGEPVRVRSVHDAIRAGIAYVPGDRLTQGVFLGQSIRRNLIAGSIDRLISRSGRLRGEAVQRTVTTAVESLRIKTSDVSAPVRTLSGGNQQRVVLGKWLARSPRVLVLNSPTVGVDIGSKEGILQVLRDRARAGMGVLVISDDVPELVSVCHRVLVVRRGRVVDEITSDRMSVQAVTDGLTG